MPIQLELPDVWLWELIDEFVYQFQAFSQYKLRPKKTIEEIDLLQDKANFNRVWNVLSVLNVLHSLIDVSNIKKQLEVSVFLFDFPFYCDLFLLISHISIGSSQRW